jgi:hypothetical protein
MREMDEGLICPTGWPVTCVSSPVSKNSPMPLEILHGALVPFRRRARFEGAEIAALAGFGIHFAGIEPVLA